MPFPLLLIPFATALGGIGLSASMQSYNNNKYARSLQDQYYQRQKIAYENLWRGQQNFYARQGLSVNPDRAWTSYYGALQGINNNIKQNLIQSQNLDYGMVQSGTAYGRSLYSSFGKAYNRL